MSAAYDPNKQGWGAAAITCLLTAGLAFTAYTIHNNTYVHPRDPMMQQVYEARDAAAEHAPAEHAAPEHKTGEAAAEKAAPAEAAPAEAAPAAAKH